MRGLLHDTFLELLDRKIIWLYVSILVLTIIIVFFSGSVSKDLTGGGRLSGADLGEIAETVKVGGMDSFLSFMVFVTVLATAGLIPGMLSRGRADFYLSKPVSRGRLLLAKALSIWMTYATAIVISGVIVYLTMLLVHGGFSWSIVYVFAGNVIVLFIWIGVTSCVGVATRSAVFAIIAAFVVWLAQSVMVFRDAIKEIGPDYTDIVVDVLYYVVPKTKQISDITTNLALGRIVESWEPLWTSLAVALVLYYLATYIVKKQDF